MKYTAEAVFQGDGFTDYEVTKEKSIYTDRLIVSAKAAKAFLLTTFDIGEVPEDYLQFAKDLAAADYEVSVNYIPVFFGCDYDDVVRVMDDFAKKIREDYL